MSLIFRRFLSRRGDTRAPESSGEILVENKQESEGPYVISSTFYLAVILFIGVPIWLYTCSITRYPLPDLTSLRGHLNHPDYSASAKLHLDVSVVQLSKYNTQTDDSDSQTKYLRDNLPKILTTSIENVTYHINWRVRRPTHEENDIFKLHKSAHSGSEGSSPNALQRLEQQLLRIHKPFNRFRLFMFLIEEQNYPAFCGAIKPHTFTLSFERFVYLCPSLVMSPDSQASVVNIIYDVLKETYANTINKQTFKHNLGSQVDLLFSLIPESSDKNNLESLYSAADKIHFIYDKNVRKVVPELRELFNIRPVTQNIVDLLDDKLLKKLVKKATVKKVALNESDQETGSRTLETSKIGDLFYRFESRVNKHSSASVYNVLCISPDSKKQRMTFREKTQADQLEILVGQDSFSIIIINDDRSLVLEMRAILRKLVGLADVNLCKNCIVRRDVFFNRWEIDVIMGALTMKKLYDTLISLESIGQQVVGVKIPKDVSDMTREAHDAALKSIDLLRTGDGVGAFRLSSKAFELSESAFYDPSLLESLYFPDDLKYAIYLPLFLPLALPILMSAVRLVRYFFKSLSKSRETSKLKIN